MRRLSLIVAALLSLGAAAALAQTGDVYDLYGGVYHPYRHGSLSDTRAPRGYVPFYISHLGRHGSRYPVDRPYVMNGMGPLVKADSLGILTGEGKRLLAAFAQLDSMSTGVYGFLCDLGVEEQKAIGRRMAARFPQVFAGRDSIVAISTHKPRCIMSAAGCMAEIKAAAPRMRVSLRAGERYYDYMSRENVAKPGLKRGSALSDARMAAEMDFPALYSRLFTDTERARSVLKSDRLLAETIYTNGTVALYLGLPELVRCLTPEEYRITALAYNSKMYVQHCRSVEQGEWRVHIMDPMLRELIDKADAAVAGNDVAVDLRFSHDVGMMPFMSLIGIEGYDKVVTFDKADEAWNSTLMMPMAANLQLVFYRHRRDASAQVLVKFLLNEQETSLPALGPGPYYRWDELRAYLVSCLK